MAVGIATILTVDRPVSRRVDEGLHGTGKVDAIYTPLVSLGCLSKSDLGQQRITHVSSLSEAQISLNVLFKGSSTPAATSENEYTGKKGGLWS